MDDAEIAVVAYGSTARTARRAVAMARAEGIRAGNIRPVTIWPFPGPEIQALTENARAVVVAELNLGQVRLEVERATNLPVLGAHHAGGAIMRPETILETIKEAAKHGQRAAGRVASV